MLCGTNCQGRYQSGSNRVRVSHLQSTDCSSQIIYPYRIVDIRTHRRSSLFRCGEIAAATPQPILLQRAFTLPSTWSAGMWTFRQLETPAREATTEVSAPMWGLDFNQELNLRLRISMVSTGDTSEFLTMTQEDDDLVPIQRSWVFSGLRAIQ